LSEPLIASPFMFFHNSMEAGMSETSILLISVLIGFLLIDMQQN